MQRFEVEATWSGARCYVDAASPTAAIKAIARNNWPIVEGAGDRMAVASDPRGAGHYVAVACPPGG